MPAYVIAHLWSLQMGPVDVREGSFPGDVIVLEFPDRERARGWYESDAYQAILPLRTSRSEGWVIIADGVPADHRATDILIMQ